MSSVNGERLRRRNLPEIPAPTTMTEEREREWEGESINVRLFCERERDREKKSTSVFMWVWYELEIVAGVCLYRYFMPLLLCFYILNHRCYSCYQPNVIILVDFFFQILNKFFIFTHSHRIFFSHGKIENLILTTTTTADMWQDGIGREKFTDDIRRRFQPSIISPTIFQRLWSSVKWSTKKFMTLFITDGQNCW